MNAVLVIVLVVVAIIVIAVVAFVVSYNKFARQRNSIEESWRQIDVELQRRHDLIGNLVEVTKAAAKFEQQTLTQVVQARGQAVAAKGAGPAAQGQAEQALNGALSNFFAVAEQYPDLKANQDFIYLQTQMVECEDRIAGGRRVYNENVRVFNTRFDTFPSSIIANIGKFQKKEYYEVDDPAVRAAPSLRGAFDSLNEPVTPTPPLGQPMIQPQHAAAGPAQSQQLQQPAQPVPVETGRPAVTSMPEQPPQTPPAPPVQPPDGETPNKPDGASSGHAMPEEPPQTPPAPPVQPPKE